MKVIIAGSRYASVEGVIPLLMDKLSWPVTEVVSGHSGNVDFAGEEWALLRSIPVKIFPADWSLGRKAGPIRNRQMAEYADALVAVWDGKSRGTLDMIRAATINGLTVHVEDI
jgi:hypothetical protein